MKPEGISSAEIGHGISYPSLKVTLNAYCTLWSNKTTTSNGADSYCLPTSRNLDLHLGYDFQPAFDGRVRFGLKGSVLNVLNEFYFTDVSNCGNLNTSVADLQAFFNRGRTFTVGLSATL